MLLNGRSPIKFDKIFVKDLNGLVDIFILNPGDTIRISFLLKKWSWRNRINTVGGRNRKLSQLLMGADKLRIDIDFYLHYTTNNSSRNNDIGNIEKDKTNRVSVVKSKTINVWTQDEDCRYTFDIVVPEYDNNSLSFFPLEIGKISKVSSYLLISLDSRLIEDEVNIDNIIVETKEIKLGYNDRLYEFQLSSVDYSNIINFFQTTNRMSGYGMMGDGIVREINKDGDGDGGGIGSSLWKIRDFCRDGKGRVNDNEMMGLKSKIGLLLNIPTMWFKARNSKYTIGYSMFECTRIPDRWISGCNRVDRILVPVVGNIEGFRSSGVRKDIPIDVIPIGIDADIYNSSICNSLFDFGKTGFEKDTYKFLVVNDNQSRKNNWMIIKAIGEEFEKEISENKVVLITRFCHGKKLIKDKWVHNVMRYLKDEDMVKLINSCDCMVNISSGECGDIPILQGMAMEKPVIINEDKLIHSEVINEGNEMFGGVDGSGVAFPVKIDRWERAYCTNEYKGSKYFEGLDDRAKWIVPSYEDLRKQLRYVYDNRNEKSVIEVGKNARKYILEKRTVKVAVKRMLDIFNGLE
jgi:glycosyltransferase involved in cell wall biosynthesis